MKHSIHRTLLLSLVMLFAGGGMNEAFGDTNYHLIDKGGKRIETISSSSGTLGLPAEWQSPLVSKYHYYTTSGLSGDTYSPSDEITVLGSESDIYVTYDVNSTISFNTSESGLGNTGYMLHFDSGDNFRQENGNDGLMGSATQAAYPYSNGDACLYVYSEQRWNEQLASGASTRSRWLWHVLSPNSDPYRVKIMSHSGQVSSHNFFRTYVVEYGGSKHIVTGVTTTNEDAVSEPPTEYMILGTVGHYILKTVVPVPADLNGDGDTDDAGENERQTVTSFEQYWKNNPTVQAQLAEGDKVTAKETITGNLNPSNTSALTALGWHTYQAFANAAPWVEWTGDDTGTDKRYRKKSHWFQTIGMGTGTFEFEFVTLQPQVILLDNHGWEIMRAPLSDLDKLRQYSSPMVSQYHWYPTAEKEDGYHKYTISDPAPEIKIYKLNGSTGKWEWKEDDPSYETYSFTSTTLADNPYKDHSEQPSSVWTDFYVTYEVSHEFATIYQGAATEGATSASPVVLKQGGRYAKADGSSIDNTESEVDLADVDDNMQWYVKPNFNIDREMGYKFAGEPGALTGALSESEANTGYVGNGKQGFDPYNVQIQSKSASTYFTTNTSGSGLEGGSWMGTGTTGTVALATQSTQQTPEGYNHSKLAITNATFMVVDDGNGNMRLMPRFDNGKVLTSFSGLAEQAAKAAAGDDGEGTQSLAIYRAAKTVSDTDEMTDMCGYYLLSSGFTFTSSIGSSGNPFSGIIDGKLVKQANTLSDPLVEYAENAVVRNVILEDVSISVSDPSTNVGALVANATGSTRIYNCGILDGSVSGTKYVGGIAGLLDGTSRVINCYSYATIAGGSEVGGIVGHNNYASNAGHIQTMVMNCMFYGDITGGTTVSPVYGGENISNLRTTSQSTMGLNTFNYYAYDELKTKAISSGKFNCALAVETKYLTRFEFYRHLLNGNKRLAAYYATGDAANADQMAKWVLETADRENATPKPYPVLKARGVKYPSIVNIDAEHAPDSTLVGRNKGGKLGRTLSVTIGGVGSNAPAGASITTSSLTLDRTDKDYERFNYNYDKVQLPYYNDVGAGNYTGNRVVTGWKITGIDAVAGDPYTSSNYPTSGIKDYPNHNYADRKSSNKDLFSVSGRVFSQGAYFDVPYGVTSITIEPYWGQAAYVADERYDVVYDGNYNKANVEAFGKQFSNKSDVDILGNGGTKQKVYTSLSDALASLPKTTSVYDKALVLVGNLHLSNVPSNDDSKGFTLMSIDLDHDNEPDYSLIYHHNGRMRVSPVRFDFLDVIGTAQAQKPDGASKMFNFTIFKTSGWFEITNTSLAYSNQVEYENLDGNNKSDAPLILQGGVFDQFVSTQRQEVKGKTIYIHVGGNVWIKEFGLGTHSDGNRSTPHVPVSVTGGDYPNFYLTGTYNQDAYVRTDNAEAYISGGRFGEVAGGAQESINGNVRWQIYDADIDNFYGGGINAAKPIQGTVTTEIFNSHVGTFCGGPKFGDMQSGKKVTTTAEGCTFGQFFGGGFGGTSYSKKKYYDATAPNFNTLQNNYINDRGKFYDGKTTKLDKDYGYKGVGVATDFDYEFFVWSSGSVGARFFVKFASFTLARCNDVESNLKKCHIEENFYGGGSFGEVSGKATSVLDGCRVDGSVFGGGYSAQLPEIEVRKGGFATGKVPKFNSSSGMFEPGVFTGTDTYGWTHVDNLPDNGGAGFVVIDGKNYIKTDVDLTALGKVGETDLTVKGNTVVAGNVFGGGDESAVSANATTGATGNTKVTIQKEGEEAPTVGYVYGGGNTADVDGDAEVRLTGGTVSHDVYGGGKGAETIVGGMVTVNLGAKDGSTLSGEGSVSGDVYGGSALGAVNTSSTKDAAGHVTAYTPSVGKTTNVNLYGGTVTGNVYGGGLGQTSPSNIVARNFGNTTINLEGGTVSTAVYGGANVNGVLKKDATVTITGGTVNANPAPSTDISNVVFGGGFGQPTIVEGDVTVNIGTLTAGPTYTGNATLYGHVYGGSALGKVNVNESLEAQTDKHIDVNLYAGTIHGNVFGGGLGVKATGTYGEEGYDPGVEAVVGGGVNVLLDGAKFVCRDNGAAGDDRMPITGQIFGCNNLNGTPKGHVLVHVKRTVDSEKSDATPFDLRTTYDVAAVYGGGNQADYVPTKALSGDEAVRKQAFAQVIIEGCDETSIEYVYGGGNAAAVPATDVTIKGTYIIDYLFGGGNGKSTASFTNPGADVGIYKVGNTPTYYGTGVAVTTLYAGKVRTVFGGSNTKGNVHGGTQMTMPQKPDGAASPEYCSVLEIKNIYGAGNQAEQDGDVNLVLGCVTGMENVYGGAKAADIAGGVNLTITSGHYSNVFGGNNESGTIQGSITLNIEETACDPVTIDNLYLGGYLAPYSVYGYKDVAGTLTARTKAEYDGLTEEQKLALVGIPYSDPVLNVISCTSIGNVFGGGYGAGAVMYGSPTVNVNMMPGDHAADIDRDGDGKDNNPHALGTIGHVYGGGREANVYGDATINIGTGTTVSLNSKEDDPATLEVRENEFPVEGARIIGDVYGGGLSANVYGGSAVNIGTKDYTTTGYEGVSITGRVFGGGQGETTKVTGSVAVKIGERTPGGGGDPDTYTGRATITGDVYGGSALGSVNADGSPLARTAGAETSVTLNVGTITGSVYGGGLGERNGVSGGTKDVESDVYGPVTVTVHNGSVSGAVYGCNNLNGSPKNTVAVNITGTTAPVVPATYTIPAVYGGGNQADYDGTGGLSVSMSGGYVQDVFGGGLGSTADVVGNTEVTVSGGTIVRNIYGGGSEADVTGNTEVTVSGGTVKTVYGGGNLANVSGNTTVDITGGTLSGTVFGTVTGTVFGGGYGETTKVGGSVEVNIGAKSDDVPPVYSGSAVITGDVYGGSAKGKVNTVNGTSISDGSPTTHVNLYGGAVSGSLYGGGLGEDNEGTENDHAADVFGVVTVTTKSGSVANVYGCNNILGSPKSSTVAVNIDGGTISNNVYGGGNLAPYTGNPTVTMSGGTVQNVYGGGLGASAVVTGSTAVTISGGTIGNDVYGGGSQADVTGNVDVSVSGGTITHDVYGGGALANTNTGNWNSGTGTWNDTSTGTYYAEVKHVKKDVTDVSAYYTRSDGEPPYTYTPAIGTAAENTKYYKKLDGFLNIAANGTAYKTTLSLTGGTVGNAYGGGLGQFTATGESTGEGAVAAMVYGDVSVTVDGTKFTQVTERVDGKAIPLTGRVFGGNNKNGTPKGSVLVWVKQTKRLDGASGHVKNQFELQGVYGGGNMSNYVPDIYDVQTEFGQKTKVLIQDCGTTSIERVYGGGNASNVPFSDVVIDGSFQIGYVFGGGNGGDKINKGTGAGWEENPGANVTDYTNVLLIGGTIGDAFGGSDSKGSVGNTELTKSSGTCPLVINNVYGASKEADSDGDVTLNLSGCGSGEVDKVFGGSYNANVHGSVTINITSGIYTSVYGGNDRKGSIGGNIIVNIEEVDECNPIIIQNLFGGGSQADYPGADAKRITNAKDESGHYTGEGVAYNSETGEYTGLTYADFTSGTITLNIKAATRIDRIFGGCDNAKMTGNTAVNINMVKGSKAGDAFTRPVSYTGDPIPNIQENVIDDAIGTIGFVYGGGNQGDVEGNTTVNIGTEVDVTFVNTPAHLTPNGSGKYNVLGAHIYGDVFGGGNEGDVTGNTTVSIGTADYSGTANFEGIFIDKDASGKGGSVYGGGNQADVLGNTSVTMSDGYIFNGIFGGGLAGSVGTYTRSTAAANVYGHTSHDGCIGKPIECTAGGKCTVVVNGGQIGPVTVATQGVRRSKAEGGPVPEGWVWGGGRGLVEDPATHPDMHFQAYVNETDVTIGGTAFILESVIGGGEFGRVLGNTLVKIQGNCQIGVGYGQYNKDGSGNPTTPKRYDDDDFINPATATTSEIEAAAAKMPECSFFEYGNAEGEYLPYDPYYDDYSSYVATHPDLGPASTANPSDGKTWIGCVFGGGSGYMPYVKADGSGYDWCNSAGLVEGNTEVRISGGHILTNVYGANEYTDVKGKATVTMTGGTIGVPRTLTQIVNHPQTCYLFGGGKGDVRSHFNQCTDVGSVEVDVSGGIIYGSVFGGAEDGHVLGDASVTIRKGADFTIGSTTYTNGPVIGTWGTSYVDGNVFGGGRGFSGETLMAGNIGGNVNVTITGGTMLGSIFGGGRLGSVGYDLATGEMQEGDSHGHVTVDISDATGKTMIGNKYEFQYMTSTVDTSGKTEEQIAAARKAELLTTYHVTASDFSYNGTRYMINHTRGGSVYGGGMGRRELLSGAKNTIVDWTRLGNVKSTKVNIHGDDIWLKGSVFGGGEFGAVTGSHTSLDSNPVGTEVIINGTLTIGSVIGSTNNTYNATLDTDNRTQIGSSADENRYSFGGAYGGSLGTDIDAVLYTPNSQMKIFGGLVSSNTSIKVLNGASVRSSVYGGGKVACVGGDTYVTVNGGHVGVNQVRPSNKYVLFGGMRMGNVYGGGRGSTTSVVAGLVKGNTNVTVSSGGIYHNVYGGGALGSVGDFDLSTEENKASYGVMYANVPVNWKGETGTARVTITGGTIGINGHDNGMVNGSSRGDISTNQPTSTAVSDPYDHVAWVKNTVVTIGAAGQGFTAPQPQIKGSVYGGGENGHNYGDAEVYVHSGTIGVVDTNEDTWSNRGSVYGAGCGTDTYEKHYDESTSSYVDFTDGYNHHNPMGGRVQGNSTVSIDGGHVLRSVYGAGSMGSVSGNATVTISGGRIGTDGVGNGDVLGGPKGSLKIDPSDTHAAAHVENTTVTIGYATTPASDDGSNTHAITGSVYGGGEAGLARGSVTVNMTGGLILNNLYGGGAFADTNTKNWNASTSDWVNDAKKSALHTTHVSLTGGTVRHDVYGGGLGQFERDEEGTEGDPGYVAPLPQIAPKVYGDILLELNGKTTGSGESVVVTSVADNARGCVVNKVFGCNDMQGTPMGHVKVHVFSTQHDGQADISAKVPSYHPNQGGSEGYKAYLLRLIGEAKPGGTLLTGVSADTISTAQTLYDGLPDEEDLTEKHKADIITKANHIVTELEGIHVYDVDAVYGGGDLAPYVPKETGEYCEVIIEGCETTSIRQVYGGGNAASTPACKTQVKECFLINDVFGGGNGLANYQIYGKWYENAGANVGYTNFSHYDTGGSHGTGADEAHKYEAITNTSPDATTKEGRQANYLYGSGEATTEITGGRIRKVYGGSNQKGNIRTMALSQYQESDICPLFVGETYGAGKNADIDGEVSVIMDCVKNVNEIYGGSMNANLNSGVTLNITNGTFKKVFGGNNLAGTINGPITVNIEERGCTPITIEELYGGGYLAPYSVYGYKTDTEAAKNEDGTNLLDELGAQIYQKIPYKPGEVGALATPHRDPQINIISATRIDNVYGGGYKALFIGSPHINVNMTNGKILKNYADKDGTYSSLPQDASGNRILNLGTIGTIYGGGNQADVLGNTYVDIGTGQWLNVEGVITTKDSDGHEYTYEEKTPGVWKWYDANADEVAVAPTPFRKEAVITGSVFGGGRFGNVGYFTKTDGKPTSCRLGTGKCHVTISHGEIGPDDMQMTTVGGPDDDGHVFGAGRGSVDLLYDDDSKTPAQKQTAIAAMTEEQRNAKIAVLNNLAYVDSTEVLINGDAFVKGSAYGGGFDGHVLHDTHIIIDGDCQIGNGDGVNRLYTAEEWAYDVTADPSHYLPECAHWPYTSPYAPHDMFADAGGGYEPEGAVMASDGHTFYGNVFGGGSGYYPYMPGKWIMKSGWVEGNTLVEIRGGHVLTNIYGGNEMTNVGDDNFTAGKGKCTVRMSGGTLGVPRTLAQIAAHPVTCYLFGAGKGDQNVHFNTDTNVKETEVEITGGRIYGSVFGGGEDGHVWGDVRMTIGNSDGTGPVIGTWGTSYVDGNVFGGGRGYSGEALTAGNVGGSIDLSIKGGTMLGSVYGGGRLGSVGYGLYAVSSPNYGVMRDDGKDDADNSVDYYTTTGPNKKGRGHIEIDISGGTIGNTHEYAYITGSTPPTGTLAKTGYETVSFREKLTNASETTITEAADKQPIQRLVHTRGGNVFVGGMGRRLQLDNMTEISNWLKLGNVKSTKLTVRGTAWIKSNVYGGGEFGAVVPFEGSSVQGGTTIIDIQGGTIGTEVKKEEVTQYTFGSIFGGGMGERDYGLTENHGGTVGGNTSVSVSGADTKVLASVFGGGESSVVEGDAHVTISNGKIGYNKVRHGDGYVMYGSHLMGNVYGAGMGVLGHPYSGQVKGNTTIDISGGEIYHNVYGGGALASVGDFHLVGEDPGDPSYIPEGIPYGWKPGTGTATINITGGVIGISGRDNGMVNGAGRGDIDAPAGTPAMDPYDVMAWVNNSVVNIGTQGANTYSTPLVKGNVYGGGENGHNAGDSHVSIHSGTVGIVSGDWATYADEALGRQVDDSRGGVYGAGCGQDTYTGADGIDYHNPKSGMVAGNTYITVDGGLIARNVYGGGSIASVGVITNVSDTVTVDKHTNPANSFALSWPYKLTYAPNTGMTTITIKGGHIGKGSAGEVGIDNGNIYGGSRGKAGNYYLMAHLSNVRESHITVDLPYDGAAPSTLLGSGHYDEDCIEGSVFGGGEDGHVYEDTHVDIRNGLISHSVFGGGRGEGTYLGRLKKVTDGTLTASMPIRSWMAGKVYGNTHVVMRGGRVLHNVLGGGYMASVGKGNYASGADDYYPDGYGEALTGNLWDGVSDDSQAFLNSGNTYVTLLGGEIGVRPDESNGLWDGMPAGSVFGGCRGISAPNLVNVPREQYCPDFFNGYVNETYVSIGGGYECVAACTDKHDKAHAAEERMSLEELQDLFEGTAVLDGENKPKAAYWEPIADTDLKILGSVYGGGQDGHVRRNTHVTIHSGEIGLPFTSANRSLLGTTGLAKELDSPHWLHRGNVYGAGSGLSKYKFDFNYDGDTADNDGSLLYEGSSVKEEDYSNSAGSVTCSTQVNLLGGVVHRNIYGGGSLASVGPPPIPLDRADMPDKKGDTTTHGGKVGWQSTCEVNIAGTVGSPSDYQKMYGGEVYGASRGQKVESDPTGTQFASVIWTIVNILNGADIKGNVFGGGDAGIVKKDTEVNVGVTPVP